MKTSGPEHARQRDTLGRPIWDDPQTPPIARRRADAMSAAWREGEPVDVWRAFRRLHFETDWEQLTGEQADEPVLRALETGDVWQPKLIQPGGTALWKGPAGRGARKASALLDERVDALIKQRREAPDPAAVDQVSRLVRQAAEDGVTTDQQIRATVKLQFPDPIHDFLTWIFWALARNPQVEQQWLEEIDTVLAGAPATVEDVKRLPYVHRVLLETMRLYPPAFGIFREALQDLDIDGHLVPAGDYVVMSQFVTHRDPRLWDDPLRFDPERWAEGATRPEGMAYFPFSAGPHACHGSPQALLDGHARGGHRQPALAPAGRERQGAGDDARHRPAAEEAAPADPRRAVLARRVAPATPRARPSGPAPARSRCGSASGRLDLAALALLAHDRLQPLAVVVLVVGRVPVGTSAPRSA